MAVQPGRPALRLLSGPATCAGRQLVRLHGVENRPPRVVVEELTPQACAACRGPHPSRSRGEIVRDGDLSEGVPLARNWSEMLPTGREHDVLLVRVLTGVLSPPRIESGPSRSQS
jgi:hypothetical protein